MGRSQAMEKTVELKLGKADKDKIITAINADMSMIVSEVP